MGSGGVGCGCLGFKCELCRITGCGCLCLNVGCVWGLGRICLGYMGELCRGGGDVWARCVVV